MLYFSYSSSRSTACDNFCTVSSGSSVRSATYATLFPACNNFAANCILAFFIPVISPSARPSRRPSSRPSARPLFNISFASYSNTYPPILSPTPFLTFSYFAARCFITVSDISRIVTFSYSFKSPFLRSSSRRFTIAVYSSSSFANFSLFSSSSLKLFS